ncbi:MAG: hypothetical protein ACYTBP_10795 [Planctomycetota bacterium]|jgi:hypothetical protein
MLMIVGVFFFLAVLLWFCDMFTNDSRLNFAIPMRLCLVATSALIVWDVYKKSQTQAPSPKPETKLEAKQ